MCLDPISRRRFLQFIAVGAAASTSVAQAQTPTPTRPQDQMTAGMIDFHVHTYPDNFDRTVSATDAAQGARERGLKAIVLKGGAFETVTRAAQANAAVPGIKVYGGVVMNWATGGINPAAVEAMAVFRGGGADKLGRVVWLPSSNSRNHHQRFKIPTAPVEAFDGTKLVPAMHERSEEHTSELQSRENLVCRLLLEKKNNRIYSNIFTVIYVLTLTARICALMSSPSF